MRSIVIARSRRELERHLRARPDYLAPWFLDAAIALADTPGDRGTQVTVAVRSGGVAITGRQLAIELVKLRQMLETGELATSARRRPPRRDDKRMLRLPRGLAEPLRGPVVSLRSVA